MSGKDRKGAPTPSTAPPGVDPAVWRRIILQGADMAALDHLRREEGFVRRLNDPASLERFMKRTGGGVTARTGETYHPSCPHCGQASAVGGRGPARPPVPAPAAGNAQRGDEVDTVFARWLLGRR